MSTITEEKRETAPPVPDWAIGYTLTLPCDTKTPQCPNEAEWFASQHGCLKAHICNDHMLTTFEAVNMKIAQHGSVRCPECSQDFTNFAAFIKAVRI